MVVLFVRTAFLRHSETSAAVTLLLDADWMMLTNASNQGEANSMTITPLAHEILTADAVVTSKAAFLKNYLAVSTWILNGSLN